MKKLIAIICLIVLFNCGNYEPKTIRGVVEKVDYIAEGSSFNAHDIKNTIVKFEDGRTIAFNGISNAIFQKGKLNVIYYSKKMRIISVKVIKENSDKNVDIRGF